MSESIYLEYGVTPHDAAVAEARLARETPPAEAGRPAAALSSAALASTLTLAACSGGGSPTPVSAPVTVITPAPPVVTVSGVQASRFLAQASFGASPNEIASVQTLGFSGWIDRQMSAPRTPHWDWLVGAGYNNASFINSTAGFDNSVWRAIITEPGQLRQRVGMALSEIMVVGIDGLTNWRQFSAAAWLDILLDNAFGNFRTLLDQITTNAAMGIFLTFVNNRKANATTGAVPDENYARELMQLFTIGLYRLNMDGTLQLSGGNPIETYTPTDVSQLARVFTGFTLATTDATTPDRFRQPMVMNASFHETGASTFLGATVPAGTEGMAAVRIALDTIFAHPNLPPFISRQLIQRLVTSNPSPAYVGRVAAIFADNGRGVRGDLNAVIRAILLDTEARTVPTAPTAGRIREPVTRLTAWARAFAVSSPSGAWGIGDTSSPTTRLGQSFGRSASVFNFFRPGYAPPNTALTTSGLVAPEFQIANELSVIGYVNFMQLMVQTGIGDVRADYADILTKAADSQALVDEVNLLLAGGQLSAATVSAIRGAVDSIAITATATTTAAANNRVYAAILLTLASPDFITFR